MYANWYLAHMALRLRCEWLQEDKKVKEYRKLGRHDSMHALRFDPLNILAIELVHYTGNKQSSSAEKKLEYLNTINRVIDSTQFDVFSAKDYTTGTEIDLEGGKMLRTPEYWSKFLGYCSGCCQNCHCQQVSVDFKNCYYFDMYEIWSDEIVATQNPLCTVEYSKTSESASKARICGECHSFLWRGPKDSQRSKKLDDDKANPRNKHQLDWKYIRQGDRCEWKYIWLAFYWNLLTGVDVRYNKMFCETHPAEHLWKMVPDGIHPYWRGSLSKVEEYIGVVGDDCKETQPHFKDITRSVNGFWTNICKHIQGNDESLGSGKSCNRK
jgi:hypothetical protein